MKKLILLTTLSILMLSCNKNDDNAPSNPAAVDSFDEINAPENFDWSTQKVVTVNVEGISNLPIARQGLLQLYNDQDELLTRYLVTMNEDVTFEANIPGRLDELKVKIGSIEKTVRIDANTVNISLMQEPDNSDLAPEDR